MEEIDLKEIFTLFWEKKVRVIILLLIFTILGTIYTFNFVTPKYSSYTTLVLVAANNASSSNSDAITSTDITMNSKLVSTYSELIKSKKILTEVQKNLHIDLNVDELRKNITVTNVKNTELIKISVSNENAKYACNIANEIAKVFMKQIQTIYNIQNVQVVDEAEVAQTPSNNHFKRDIAIFALIGLVIAIADIIIENMLDTTIKSEDDIEVYDVPVLASIPIYEEDPKKAGKGGKK